VLKIRVGYAGGRKKAPTYRSMGDHTEAIQAEYDPKKVSFENLLDVFFASHDPFARSWSTQYKAVLWTHGESQARTAGKRVAALEKARGKKVATEVAEATTFWIAEDYHQKYRLRSHRKLLRVLLGEEASGEAVRDSTLAARVNGWLAGHGTKEQIAEAIERFELSEAARAELARALGKRAPVACR
jgi:peptide-methionine (S)-S-oxide reductase